MVNFTKWFVGSNEVFIDKLFCEVKHLSSSFQNKYKCHVSSGERKRYRPIKFLRFFSKTRVGVSPVEKMRNF